MAAVKRAYCQAAANPRYNIIAKLYYRNAISGRNITTPFCGNRSIAITIPLNKACVCWLLLLLLYCTWHTKEGLVVPADLWIAFHPQVPTECERSPSLWRPTRERTSSWDATCPPPWMASPTWWSGSSMECPSPSSSTFASTLLTWTRSTPVRWCTQSHSHYNQPLTTDMRCQMLFPPTRNYFVAFAACRIVKKYSHTFDCLPF